MDEGHKSSDGDIVLLTISKNNLHRIGEKVRNSKEKRNNKET